MLLSELLVRVGADLSGLAGLGTQIAGKLDKAGDAMQRAGATMTRAVTAPVLLAGAAVFKFAGDFEGAMNEVRALTRTSGESFAVLEAKAREMGASTQYSATEAANAMAMLSKNGLSVNQIMGGGLDAALALAAATGSDLSTAADIATDAMLQFGLKASDLPAVVDQITAGTIASKFSIQDFGLAFAQAGGVAGAFGVSLLDFNTVLAGTAHIFNSGQDAGTSFKTFLQRLVPQSKEAAGVMQSLGLITADGKNQFYDAAGGMRSMGEIAGVLQTALAGLSIEQKNAALNTIFGQDAIRTAIGLADLGADGFANMAAKVNQSGIASEQAAIRMQGLGGAQERLMGAIEELSIAFGKSGLLDFFTGLVTKAGEILVRFSELEPATLRMAAGIAGFAAAIGPLLLGFGTFLKLLGFILSPIGITVAAVAALAAGAYLIYKNWEGVGAWFSKLWQSVATIFSSYMDLLLELITSLWPRAQGQFLSGIAMLMGPLQRFAAFLGADALAGSIGAFGETLADLIPQDAIDASAERVDALLSEIATGFHDIHMQGSSLATDAAAGIATAFNSTLDTILSAGAGFGAGAPVVSGDAGAAPMVGMTPLALGGAPFAIPTIGMEQLATVSNAAKAAMSNLERELQAKKEAFATLVGEIGSTIRDGLTEAIIGLAEGFGAMVAGTASLGDVGRNLLRTFAGVMQKLGGLLIAYSVAAMLWNGAGGFSSFLNPVTAPIGLAAGIALVAAGSAIKGFLGKGGSGAGGGTKAAGVTSVGVNANGGALRGGAGYGGGVANQAVDITPRALPSGDLAFATAQAHKKAGRQGTPMH